MVTREPESSITTYVGESIAPEDSRTLVADSARAGAGEGTQPGATGPRSGPLQRGDLVGRYVLLGRLGVGGMGEVYAAYDPELDRKIAIKLLLAGESGTLSSTGGHGRLLREAQAMAKLRHPNVVAVHDVGTHGERVFVAMEFVDGGNLADWIDAGVDGSGTPHPWMAVRQRFVAAGEGLAAAHAAGLIHRDFKPANVLLGSDGAVRVADFGLARRAVLDERPQPPGPAGPALGPGPRPEAIALDDATLLASGPSLGSRSSSGASLGSGDSLSMRMTVTGATLGTPAYMAPEQYTGEREVDGRADQFSFCVAMWEALYGQRPYAGDNLHSLMFAIHEGRLREPPSDVEVPAPIRRALTRGLAYDPGARWPDMRALLAELRFDPTARRRTWLSVGGGVALIGALVWGAIASRPEPVAEPPLCTGAADAFADALSQPRRAAVAERFAGFEQAWAQDLGQRLLPQLDAWATQWQAAWTDACEATHVRHEQSAELLDRRLTCLDRQRRGFVKLIDALAEADEPLARRADGLLAELGSIDACSDTDALLRLTPLPADPAAVAAITAADEAVSDAFGLYLGGDTQAASAALDQVMAQVTALDYPPLSASAEHVRGRLALDSDDAEGGERALERALALALEAGDDRLATKVARNLAHELQEAERPVEAHRWLAIAAALGERIDDDRMRGSIGITRTQVYESEGNLAAAAAAAQDAYERLLAVDPDDALVGDVLYLQAMLAYREGRYSEVFELIDRARIAWRTDIGPRHPRTVAAIGLVGGAALAAGDYERAEQHMREALAIEIDSYGPEHIKATTYMSNLAVVLRELARYDEAIGLLEQVLAIRRATPDASPAWTGRTLVNLAAILGDAGRIEEARARLDEGEALVREALGDEHPDMVVLMTVRAEVELGSGDLAAAERAIVDALGRAEAQYGEASPMLFELETLAAKVAVAAGALDRAEQRLARAPGDDVNDGYRGDRAFVEARYQIARGDRAAAAAAADRAQAAFERDGAGSAKSLAELGAWRRTVGLSPG